MRLSELKKIGFPEQWLMMAYRRRNQTFAWKMSAKENSPIVFDTEGLEKFRRSQCG